MLTNSPSTPVLSHRRFDRCPPGSLQDPMSRSLDERSRLGEGRREPADYEARRLRYPSAVDAADGTVEIASADIVKRRAVAWDGMAAEIVQATRRETIDYRFRGPRHLLVLYEQGARRDACAILPKDRANRRKIGTACDDGQL